MADVQDTPSYDALMQLVGGDPEQIRGLLAAFAPSAADNKSALTQGLLAAGLGTLASRGNFFQTAGQGGLMGLQQYNNELGRVANQRQQGIQNAGAYIGLLNAADARRQDMLSRQILQQQMGAQGGLPGSAAAAPGGAPPQPSPVPPELQSGPPMPGQSQPYPPSPPPQQPQLSAPPLGMQGVLNGQGVTPKSTVWQQYQQYGNALAANGLVKQAQVYYDLAEKMRPKLKETKTLTGQNGQPITVNLYDDGSTEVLPFSPDVETQLVNSGTKQQLIDKRTGQPIAGAAAIVNAMTPGEKASNALGYANLAETKRYHNLELGIDENGQNSNLDGVAQAIAAYKQAPLSAWAMSKPMGAAIMSKVMEINPSYDSKNFATAQQTQNAFAKGPQGNTVRSIGVAMQHLGVLSDAGDALANGDVQLFNRIGNMVQSQLGAPAPTNFNAVKDLVANEITKAITGTGGGVTDRDKAQKTVDAANSPEQLRAVIDSYKKLFAGQLGGLEQQYKAGTQQNDFRQRFLPPEAASLMSGGSGTGQRQIYVDAKGNRAYKNPDGTYTEIK